MAIRTTQKWLFLFATVATLVGAFSGCSAEDAEFASNVGGPFNPGDPVVEAENRLFEHNIVEANAIYTEGLRQDSDNGTLAVGKAFTELLLIPYSPEFGTLLTQNLGAERTLSTDSDVLYRSGGLLDLLSRGVSFQDDGNLSGIETLLEADLPWERGRLGGSTQFVAGLDTPVNRLMDNLVAVADRLEPIYVDLDIALRDASFGAFYVPGTVFYDDRLSLELGRSEVSFLRAGIAGVRSAIYFAAAYDWSWSLEDAFGARWDELTTNPVSPDYIEGYAYDDYVIAFLGDRLAREIRDASTLSDSREAARQMLLNVRGGLEFGVSRVQTNEPDRALTFSNADVDEARDVIDFVQAVENSLFAPTALPFTEPDTFLDLSSFFVDGRTMPAEEAWFERVTIVDEFGESTEWEMTDKAFEIYFVEGVFSPEFQQGNEPTLQFGDGAEGGSLYDDIAGNLSRDVESTYGTR